MKSHRQVAFTQSAQATSLLIKSLSIQLDHPTAIGCNKGTKPLLLHGFR